MMFVWQPDNSLWNGCRVKNDGNPHSSVWDTSLVDVPPAEWIHSWWVRRFFLAGRPHISIIHVLAPANGKNVIRTLWNGQIVYCHEVKIVSNSRATGWDVKNVLYFAYNFVLILYFCRKFI
ncbi:MAG: hypothetical protein LBI45_07525 [Bacteroidales bacterium]|nr:hypothetical protein [Bacteroidales bacterium]